MKGKMKIATSKAEFEDNVVSIKLPSGEKYYLIYEPEKCGIVVLKEHKGRSHINLEKHGNNQVFIK
jgi:hypothetical protein